jgi:hypothetical protein
VIAYRSVLLPLTLPPSWPGLSRPSMTSFCGRKDVDARHKAGHDDPM